GGRWESAGAEHWFGTNVLGQDIFERAMYSVRTAFDIGLVVALIFVPIVIAYQTWVFVLFKDKVTKEDLAHEAY
ncbi:MAG: hypothetical protein ACWGSD_11975, partial [Thermodesulfobacteriota bacterium]